MKYIVVENTWIKGMNKGWGNGYVLIPEGHPDHGKPYDDIDVDVHGGLTYAELCDDEMIERWPVGGLIAEEDKGCWVVGFDTCHYSDTPGKWPKEAVEMEAERLRDQLLSREQEDKRSVANTPNQGTEAGK
jgi:hypothetical protein